MGCPCGKLSGSDVPSLLLNTKDREPVNQFGHLYYKTEVLGTIAETPASGGMEGGSMNQTTSMSE